MKARVVRAKCRLLVIIVRHSWVSLPVSGYLKKNPICAIVQFSLEKFTFLMKRWKEKIRSFFIIVFSLLVCMCLFIIQCSVYRNWFTNHGLDARCMFKAHFHLNNKSKIKRMQFPTLLTSGLTKERKSVKNHLIQTFKLQRSQASINK